jgi:chromosome segregation ATPase
MVGLGLSQLFSLSVNTYEGFTSTSRHPRVEKINGLKKQIALKKEQQTKREQRIDIRIKKIRLNNASIDKHRDERDNLEKTVMNVKDPVAKATALKSSDNEIKKRSLTNNIKVLKEENDKLRTEIEQIKGNKRDTKTELDKLETDLKKAEADLAAHNARKKAKQDAKAKQYSKANANVKANADADAKAKARKEANANKLLKNKNVKQVGPGPAKATAKFSLMQEDDSDDSDEEMETNLQTKRPDGFDFLDPAKISGLTQGTTKLMTTQKDLFTFMNSITPFIENAKKMLKDVDVNQLTAGSK